MGIIHITCPMCHNPRTRNNSDMMASDKEIQEYCDHHTVEQIIGHQNGEVAEALQIFDLPLSTMKVQRI